MPADLELEQQQQQGGEGGGEPSLESAFENIDAGTAVPTGEGAGAGSGEPGGGEGGGSPSGGEGGGGDGAALGAGSSGAGQAGEGAPAAPTEADLAKLPKGFRDHYLGEIKTAKDENKKLADRIKELETRGGTDTSALTETLKQREQRIEELQQKLAGAEFQKSEAYVEKYDKPFDKTSERARQEVESLEIVTERDAEGNITGKRAATWTDFANLYNNPNRAEARRLAKERFGEDADIVLGYMNQLRGIAIEAADALQAEREGWQKRQQEAQAQEAVVRNRVSGAWVTVNKDLETKFPSRFGVDASDPKEAELRNAGLQLVDSYLQGRHKMPAMDRVVMEAQLRQRAAAMPVMEYRLNKALAENAKLKAQLAQGSGAPGGQGQRGTEAGTSSEDAELEGLLQSSFDKTIKE